MGLGQPPSRGHLTKISCGDRTTRTTRGLRACLGWISRCWFLGKVLQLQPGLFMTGGDRLLHCNTAGVTANSFRVVFDPAGMNTLAYLFRRNESASEFNPPRMIFASGYDPSRAETIRLVKRPGTNPLAVSIPQSTLKHNVIFFG